jgi:hypothetical protein
MTTGSQAVLDQPACQISSPAPSAIRGKLPLSIQIGSIVVSEGVNMIALQGTVRNNRRGKANVTSIDPDHRHYQLSGGISFRFFPPVRIKRGLWTCCLSGVRGCRGLGAREESKGGDKSNGRTKAKSQEKQKREKQR